MHNISILVPYCSFCVRKKKKIINLEFHFHAFSYVAQNMSHPVWHQWWNTHKPRMIDIKSGMTCFKEIFRHVYILLWFSFVEQIFLRNVFCLYSTMEVNGVQNDMGSYWLVWRKKCNWDVKIFSENIIQLFCHHTKQTYGFKGLGI